MLCTAGLSSLPIRSWSETSTLAPELPTSRVPLGQIGLQLYTIRDLIPDEKLGVEGTLELLQDVGITKIELAGNFLGYQPQALGQLTKRYGIQIVGNHFGPRTMDGENWWYDDAKRDYFFSEANALGLEYIGTGHYYNVPLTIDGFKRFAQNLNVWGAAASKAGLKFYYHNHDGEFSRFGDKPIFDILLEETDPDLVYFELDIGWTAIAGENVAEIVRRHQRRFPFFHIKDFEFDNAGPRETKPNTLAAGERFTFTDVGKGQIDWVQIFAGLEDPSRHVYLIERDDANNSTMVEGSPEHPTNPAGSANTVWVSYEYLKNLEF